MSNRRQRRCRQSPLMGSRDDTGAESSPLGEGRHASAPTSPINAFGEAIWAVNTSREATMETLGPGSETLHQGSHARAQTTRRSCDGQSHERCGAWAGAGLKTFSQRIGAKSFRLRPVPPKPPCRWPLKRRGQCAFRRFVDGQTQVGLILRTGRPSTQAAGPLPIGLDH
jgi:hypothetical protein